MRLREALADLLAAEGIDTWFGLMGDGNMHLVLDAHERHGIRFVNARHETAAVLMADGYARASGRLSAVTMTHGPGLAAAGLGIRVAHDARAKLLVIAGDVTRSEPLHVQAMDQETFARSLVDDVVSVRASRNAVAAVRRAIGRIRRGDGPAVVSLAVDVQEEDVGDARVEPVQRVAAPPVVAVEDDVVRLAQRLHAARRPLILAGRGAQAASAALSALAVRTGAMLATTVPARGMFRGHPHDLGLMGGLTHPARRPIFEPVDLVIAFGAGVNRFTADHGRLAPNADWVQVTHADEGLPPQVDIALTVRGDAGDVAKRLLASCTEGRAPWTQENIDLSGLPTPAPVTPGTLDPSRVVQLVNTHLPADRAEVVGVGHFGGWPCMYSDIGPAGQLIAPWDFGAIGVAVPVATGAALARPDRITLAWEGDGSLLASLGELETLARTQARVIVMVMDDGAYTAEVRKLRLLGRDTALACFGRADLAGAARALGVPAHTATDDASLAAALQAAAHAGGPVLVHVHIDPEVHQSVF